jgi:hypothetical protein
MPFGLFSIAIITEMVYYRRGHCYCSDVEKAGALVKVAMDNTAQLILKTRNQICLLKMI